MDNDNGRILFGVGLGICFCVVMFFSGAYLSSHKKNDVVRADVSGCFEGKSWARKLCVVEESHLTRVYTLRVVNEDGSLSDNRYMTFSVYEHKLLDNNSDID